MQIFNKLIYIIKNIKMIQLYYFGYLNIKLITISNILILRNRTS